MSTVTYTAKISPQGQITIPKKLRERLATKSSHASIRLRYAGNDTLEVNPEPAIVRFFGSLQPAQPHVSTTQTIQSMRADARKRQQNLQNIMGA